MDFEMLRIHINSHGHAILCVDRSFVIHRSLRVAAESGYFVLSDRVKPRQPKLMRTEKGKKWKAKKTKIRKK
jgi:hypothetical protein